MPKVDRKILSIKAEVVENLKKIIKAENVLDHEDQIRPFETDALSAYKQKPLAVIFPENTEEVSKILAYCNQQKIILEKHSHESIFTAETDIKYEGYVKIENARVNKLMKMETVKIPNLFDYSSLTNLSSESKEKLCRVKPETLGQASRIAGVRPSDIGVLAIFLKPAP